MKKIFLFLILSASVAFAEDVTVIKSEQNPIHVTGTVTASAPVGAAHEANSQVTASNVASTLVIARPTRVSCLVRNMDSSINVYIGAATVTSSNGMLLKPGESIPITAVTLWQVIAASGSPVVAVIDEYN